MAAPPSPSSSPSSPSSPPSSSSSTSQDAQLPGNPRSAGTDETDLKDDASGPRRFIVDPAGQRTHDETTVDVVTVPCPGGDAVRSWTRDGLMGRYFGELSMRSPGAPGAPSPPPPTGPSWVRQGIRREAPRARILLYHHPAAPTLAGLADALLAELRALREAERGGRPLVFVAHSVGGLVVKMALTKASRDARHHHVLRECYGVAFFGTPHQGSGYLAMPSLAAGIQALLQLSAPLPPAVAQALRVGNRLLQHVDDDFRAVASDMRVWTLYETIDSRLLAGDSDVYLTAPLTSVRSAILGLRQETILPLQSDHANMASFGRPNAHTLRLFLRQLAAQIRRADAASRVAGPSTLGLDQKVAVEVHGFFDDAPALRAWSTRLLLREFLAKGPVACLSERLCDVDGAPDEGRFLRARGRTSLMRLGHDDDEEATGPPAVPPPLMTVKNALGIQDRQLTTRHVVPASPMLRPVDAPTGLATPSLRAVSPATRHSRPVPSASLIRAHLEQDLAVDRLSPPLRPRVGRVISRSFSLGSGDDALRHFAPLSPRSRSAAHHVCSGGGDNNDEDDIEASPRLPEAVVAIRRAAEERPDEPAATREAPLAAFVKPDVRARRFVWVHVPFNNPTWVKDVLQALEVAYQKDYSALYGHDFWAARHTRGRHSQHYAYFAKPGCYYTAPRTMSPRPSLGSPSPGSPTPPPAADDSTYTCLFLPYLHFDSYKRLIRRRELIQQRLGHGRARPVPEAVARSESLELQVVWEYLGHDPPVNCRRTLDQFGYPSLRDTRSRDDDQMLYKLTKDRGAAAEHGEGVCSQGSSAGTGTGTGTGTERSWRERLMGHSAGDDEAPQGEETVRNGNVLVDQLWLWVMDSHTLVSFFPKREGDLIEGPLHQQADLRDSILSDVNAYQTRQCESALDLAALAALHAVSVLLDRSSHPDLEVFRIFEAISVLTEKLTASLKDFRAESFRDKAGDEPLESEAPSIRARHRAEGRRAERDNRDSTSALLELRDLEDELQMLGQLFDRQARVLAALDAAYARPELRAQTTGARALLAEALRWVRGYARQADDMERRARATRADYDKLLQMVQRQAQVDEVRLGRLHADLATAQGRSVTIFTTFTVIFLPLTFFTGLFGMNTREWGGAGNLPLATIGAVALPASVVLVAAALVMAFSARVRRAVLGGPVLDGPALGRRRGRRREDAPGQRLRLPVESREMSDFWARHRPGRQRGYEIPEANRRVPGGPT